MRRHGERQQLSIPAIAFPAHFRLNATQHEVGYNARPLAVTDRQTEWAPLFVWQCGADNLRAQLVQYAFGFAFLARVELPERGCQAIARCPANADPLKSAATARLSLEWPDSGHGPRTIFVANCYRNRDAAHGLTSQQTRRDRGKPPEAGF